MIKKILHVLAIICLIIAFIMQHFLLKSWLFFFMGIFFEIMGWVIEFYANIPNTNSNSDLKE